ncbi:RNA polymerase sigma factor [Flagellimonas amoyensis]|uniref:RNA polymerase sigma factor n=1 Tax=Flagellimonas amoyensis TaxID=2169401 RepID=UPI000D35E239|nr:RNA polymerase sigma factor [Allomuricauda amoyensis]
MLTTNEKELINKIRNGNTVAFSDLVDGHKDLVYTLCIRMLGNREDAEEVSQDVFIKVFTALRNFKGDSKLSTWIYRIAYNACLDRLKRTKKERMRVEVDHLKGSAFSVMDNALDRMVQEERSVLINSCLAALPAEDASILTLFYFEEKNLLEMEKVLDLSANTIKVRLFRARKKLAAIMERKFDKETVGNNG